MAVYPFVTLTAPPSRAIVYVRVDLPDMNGLYSLRIGNNSRTLRQEPTRAEGLAMVSKAFGQRLQKSKCWSSVDHL